MDDKGDRKLRMVWTESGGPKVMPPVRTGFGYKLLTSLKEAGLCEEMEIEFPPDGLMWRIECRELQVTADSARLGVSRSTLHAACAIGKLRQREAASSAR